MLPCRKQLDFYQHFSLLFMTFCPTCLFLVLRWPHIMRIFGPRLSHKEPVKSRQNNLYPHTSNSKRVAVPNIPTCHESPCMLGWRPACLNGALQVWLARCMLGCHTECLDATLNAWVAQCMLGCRLACLDGALHAWMDVMATCKLGWRTGCLHCTLHAWMAPCKLG